MKVWRIHIRDASVHVSQLHSFAPTFTEGGKASAVTSLSFAPLDTTSVSYLSLGLESGALQVWKVPLQHDGAASDGDTPIDTGMIPLSESHIAPVTKLAWRPSIATIEQSMYLASGSSDNGCRVFEFLQSDAVAMVTDK